MIDEIRRKVADALYEFSRHAVDQSIIRNISVGELVEAIESGTVIEDYPNDKYGPSCLILGFTKGGRPIHVQCTSGSRELMKVITLYEPDENLWIDFRHRREANEG
jgi:hypothetical protein